MAAPPPAATPTAAAPGAPPVPTGYSLRQSLRNQRLLERPRRLWRPPSGGHYYGGTYPAYHPPTTVNVYGSGCYNCGGWNAAGAAAAGMAVGMATGAAIASANTAAATSSAYSAGVAAGSANTAVAYNAGVAAGAGYPVGSIQATLRAGCATPTVRGQTYYLCGNTWFQPNYGANGVYYRVVPIP